MRLAHHTTAIATLRQPTPSDPLRVLVSGCLTGLPCGVEGTDYGLGAVLWEFLSLKTLKAFPFCPEDNGLGTPRTMPDIHGGDGYDVLDGRARVLDEHGTDLTEKMIYGARNMLVHAQAHQVELAILTDMSAACGSQVISRGCRLVEKREFVASVGVATALLLRNGIPVVSQRDPLTLGRIRALMELGFSPDPATVDYHESPWYQEYFRPVKQ